MPVQDRSFASVDQLTVLIANFIKDEPTSPETSSDQLQNLLNEISDAIRGEWDERYNGRGNNPAPSRPVNLGNSGMINLILELLCLEEAWLKLTKGFIADKYVGTTLYVKTFSWLQEARREVFKTGGLDGAIIKHIKGRPLENDSFLDATDLARETSGLTLTESTLPSLATAQMIGRHESAWARAVGDKFAYPNKISLLSTAKLSSWKSLVAGMACPQVKRISIRKYTAQQNDSIYYSLKDAWDRLLAFSSGDRDASFK